jgi:phospholipase D1/2
LTVHDVFIIDTDFRIERPKRYYRQGFNLLTHPDVALEDANAEKQEHHETRSQTGRSIRSRLSRILHVGHHHDPAIEGSSKAPEPTGERGGQRGEDSESPASPGSSDDEDEGQRLARQITPILDPSTNTNPLLGEEKNPNAGSDKKKKPTDVSKHTFYIENSQGRLKLFARNEVRQRL